MALGRSATASRWSWSPSTARTWSRGCWRPCPTGSPACRRRSSWWTTARATPPSTWCGARRRTPRSSRRGATAGTPRASTRACVTVGPAPAVLVLNPDVRLGPGCVPELLAARRRTGAGIVVPRLDDADGRLIASRRREPSLLRAVARRRARRGTGRPDPRPRRGRDRPGGVRGREPDGLGGGLDAAGLRRVLGCGRAVGRVLLPVLGGDGLRAAGAGCRLPDGLRPDRECRAPRGRLGREPRALAAARGQPAAAVRATARPRRDGVPSGWCSCSGRRAGRCWASGRAAPRCGRCSARAT